MEDPEYWYHFEWTEEERKKKYKLECGVAGQYYFLCYYCNYTEWFWYSPEAKEQAIKLIESHVQECQAKRSLPRQKKPCPTCGR